MAPVFYPFVGKVHAVTLFSDGQNGLDTAISGRYAVIVPDVMLPGMDGFEVLRCLRTSGNDASAPTAWASGKPVMPLQAAAEKQSKSVAAPEQICAPGF